MKHLEITTEQATNPEFIEKVANVLNRDSSVLSESAITSIELNVQKVLDSLDTDSFVEVTTEAFENIISNTDIDIAGFIYFLRELTRFNAVNLTQKDFPRLKELDTKIFSNLPNNDIISRAKVLKEERGIELPPKPPAPGAVLIQDNWYDVKYGSLETKALQQFPYCVVEPSGTVMSYQKKPTPTDTGWVDGGMGCPLCGVPDDYDLSTWKESLQVSPSVK